MSELNALSATAWIMHQIMQLIAYSYRLTRNLLWSP